MIKWIVYAGPSLYDEDEPPIEVFLTPDIFQGLINYNRDIWIGFLEYVELEKRLREYT